MAVFDGSAVLVGADAEQFLPRVWTSADGSAWTEVATTGLDEPADMLEVSAGPDAVDAAGLFRVGPDPAVGRFLPAIWRSTDGQHWENVTTPSPAGNGTVSALFAGEDGVIVAMDVDNVGSIWRSTDGGACVVNPATVDLGSEIPFWRIASIARLGDRLVGAGKTQGDTGELLLVVVSTDGSVTWAIPLEPSPALEGGEGGESGGSVVAAAACLDRLIRVQQRVLEPRHLLPRTLQACQFGARPVLLRSTDGARWVEIDLAPLSASWIGQVVDVGDDGVMLIGRVGESPRAWNVDLAERCGAAATASARSTTAERAAARRRRRSAHRRCDVPVPAVHPLRDGAARQA